MVECGWAWGEMGKEGIRALDTLDMANGHGSPLSHPYLHKPLPGHENAGSDISSIAPSQSASQIGHSSGPSTLVDSAWRGSSPLTVPTPPKPYTLQIPPAHSIGEFVLPNGTIHSTIEEETGGGSSAEEDEPAVPVEVHENPRFSKGKPKTKAKRAGQEERSKSVTVVVPEDGRVRGMEGDGGEADGRSREGTVERRVRRKKGKGIAHLNEDQLRGCSHQPWNELVRRSLRPRLPLVLELLPQDLVLRPHPQDHYDRDPGDLRRPRDDEQPPDERAQDAALRQPRAAAGEAEERADGDHDERGVARVADDGVRAVRDELVVLAQGQLEGEVPAKRAVAKDADDAADGAEEGAGEEGGRKFPDNPEATRAFQKVSVAYDILSKPSSKRMYDSRSQQAPFDFFASPLLPPGRGDLPKRRDRRLQRPPRR
ncbi:hypothetical protein NUW54_g12507 [Trametes sanguinea]|uniref:Uncharacterized protein n=1 Tax=Trametes sanguinea TaxID=158606 RepID=A0ACC1MWN5_9APHY|nr:hypothetical protein NUW54_g12507 [Trametes sanguinea]